MSLIHWPRKTLESFLFFAGKDVPPQSLHNPPSYVQNSQYPPSYSTFTPEYPHTSHTHTPINVHFPPSTVRNFARKRSRRSTPLQYSKVQPPPISKLAHRIPIHFLHTSIHFISFVVKVVISVRMLKQWYSVLKQLCCVSLHYCLFHTILSNSHTSSCDCLVLVLLSLPFLFVEIVMFLPD